VPVAVLLAKAPLVVVGGFALAVSVVALLAWTAVLAIGSVVTLLLVVALFCALVAVANTWFGLWRMWSRSR
jgi:hypothetical protein